MALKAIHPVPRGVPLCGPARRSPGAVRAQRVRLPGQTMASASAWLRAGLPRVQAEPQDAPPPGFRLRQWSRLSRQDRLFLSWKTWAKRPPNLTKAGWATRGRPYLCAVLRGNVPETKRLSTALGQIFGSAAYFRAPSIAANTAAFSTSETLAFIDVICTA